MADFKDLRAAADRLRTATQSLSDTHDQEVVWRYLKDLEEAAHNKQEAEQRRDGMNACNNKSKFS